MPVKRVFKGTSVNQRPNYQFESFDCSCRLICAEAKQEERQEKNLVPPVNLLQMGDSKRATSDAHQNKKN